MKAELGQQRPISWRYLESKAVMRPASPYIFMLDEPVDCAIIRSGAPLRIRGWAYLEDTPLTLHVVVGNYGVVMANCEIYRPGVVNHFGDKTDGHVGFDVELPPTVQLGRNVELRFADSRGTVRAAHSLSFCSCDTYQRMFLVHIPKTAGSSVNTFMEDYLGKHACACHIESNPEWKFGTRLDNLFQDKTFISGHVHVRALRQKLTLRNTLVATMLRNPIDQLISHIAWVRRLADPGEKKRFYQHTAEIQRIATGLAELDLGSPAHLKKWARQLSGDAQSLFDNCQVRYLADRGPADRGPADRVTQRDLLGAVGNLQIFDLVGTSDRVPSFLTKVSEKMGLEVGNASGVNVRENVARTKYGLDPRDPRIREALESLIEFDQALYDEIVSRV